MDLGTSPAHVRDECGREQWIMLDTVIGNMDVGLLEHYPAVDIEDLVHLVQGWGLPLPSGFDLDDRQFITQFNDEIELHHHFSAIPAIISGDQVRLHETLTDLVLGNGTHVDGIITGDYGPDGRITIGVHEHPRIGHIDPEHGTVLIGPQGNLHRSQGITEIPDTRTSDPQQVLTIGVCGLT